MKNIKTLAAIICRICHIAFTNNMNRCFLGLIEEHRYFRFGTIPNGTICNNNRLRYGDKIMNDRNMFHFYDGRIFDGKVLI